MNRDCTGPIDPDLEPSLVSPKEGYDVKFLDFSSGFTGFTGNGVKPGWSGSSQIAKGMLKVIRVAKFRAGATRCL